MPDFNSIIAPVSQAIRGFGLKIEKNIPAKIRANSAFRHTSVGAGPIIPSANLLGSLSALGSATSLAGNIVAAGQQAEKVFNPTDNLVTSLQNLVTSIQNKNKPYTRQFEYTGTSPAALRGNLAIRLGRLREQGYTTRGRGTYFQPGVGEFDLATGKTINAVSTAPLVSSPDSFVSAATRPSFSSAPSASAGNPAERAYQQEVSRVAQLTAQDPDLQRYEAARQADAKAKDFSNSENIGMEIWARRNPTLAAKVKPGQAGYDVVQRVRQEAAQPGVGAFTATAPIFPGSTNYFSNQYQVKPPGTTTADLGAFGVQQPMPLVPQNIGQYSFQGRQPVATPPPATQGYGAVPGLDSAGSFDSTQLSKELLQRYMNALK